MEVEDAPPVLLGQTRPLENSPGDEDRARAQQRARVNFGFTMPQPFGMNAATIASIRRTEIVDLSTLSHPDAEPSQRKAIVLQILRIIAHNPHVQNGSNAQAYNRPRGYGPARPSSMTRDFPIGVQANDLQLSEAFWDLGKTIEDIITYVNKHGGRTVIGWYSSGVINDRTLTGVINCSNSSGTNNVNNSEVQVDGSGLTYHFIKIVPTDTSLQNIDSFNGNAYNDMKFDVETIGSSLQ